MPEIHVAYVEGAYRCYRVVNGLYRMYFGPRWASPRQAMRYADLCSLEGPTTRRAAEPAAVPPAASGEVQRSLGSPEREYEARIRD